VQQQAILIVAQSGRFLAQIAKRAGYPVWVADCFGDSDTLEVASQWLPITDLSDPSCVFNTVLSLSQGRACSLICGGGVESFHGILGRLPDHIKLLGNAQSTIETLKNPSQFFNILDQFAITHPETQLHPPEETTDWLSKSSRGLGGGHIQYYQAEMPPTDTYYQRYINGVSGSVLFLANGIDGMMLSINQQFSLNDPEMPFLLSGLAAPLHLSNTHRNTLQDTIDALLSQIDLYGLNSLDFILTEAGELFMLEVNPRPSASAELLTQRPQLFDLHLEACRGILPENIASRSSTNATYLHYIFAQNDTLIPDGTLWPSNCHDIPPAGRLILKNEPLCTALVDTSDSFSQSREQLDNDINRLLSCALKNS